MSTTNAKRIESDECDGKICSFAKRAGGAVLALLVSFILLPTIAFQPTQAIADEVTTPISADVARSFADVGIEATVQGQIRLRPYDAWSEERNEYIQDRSFAYGHNKVVIDRTQYDGHAWAQLEFAPQYTSGQDNVTADWESIPAADKYSMSTIRLTTSDRFMPEESDILELTNITTDSMWCALELQANYCGATEASIIYEYVNPTTNIRYTAKSTFMVYVVDGPNEAVDIFAPSEELTIWAAGSSPSASDLMASYYYDYGCNDRFWYNAQEYLVACETAIPYAPATFDFFELFDISIADTSVVSAVTNLYRGMYVNDTLEENNGPDAHTYSLEIVPASAGTTDVTFSLKQHPEKSVTVKVTVLDDHPEAIVANHDMQINVPKKISVDGTSPVRLPITAEYLYYRMSWARPFVASLTSSNTDIVEVVPLPNPAYFEMVAPYQLIPLSVGTANMTLTDCYGKVYTYTITVKPDPNESNDGDEEITTEALKILCDGNDVTQNDLTISTRDVAGKQLAATINGAAASSSVTLTWESSNPSIATVDEATGLLTPVRASYDEATGKTADCRIRVTANGKVTRYCNLIVEAPQGLCAAASDSPLGAASIKLNSALPQDVLDELDTVALSISSIASGAQDAIDSATSDLAANGATIQGVYDIHFVNKDDGAEHAWNKPTSPITVQIPMDDQMRELYSHGTLRFYHVDPTSGEREAMRTWVDKDLTYIYFETTHFSPFALVFEPEESNTNGDEGNTNAGNTTTGTTDGNTTDGDPDGKGEAEPDNTGDTDGDADNSKSDSTKKPSDNNTGNPNNVTKPISTVILGTDNNVGGTDNGTNNGTSTAIMTTTTNGDTALVRTGDPTAGSGKIVQTGDPTTNLIASGLLCVFFTLMAIVIINRKRFGFELPFPKK